jgi:hypothetical protein
MLRWSSTALQQLTTVVMGPGLRRDDNEFADSTFQTAHAVIARSEATGT